MPVAALKFVELHLLAGPEDAQRQKAHQPCDNLRHHRGEGVPEIFFTVDSIARGAVQFEDKQGHGDGEDAVAEGCETLDFLGCELVVRDSHHATAKQLTHLRSCHLPSVFRSKTRHVNFPHKPPHTDER